MHSLVDDPGAVCVRPRGLNPIDICRPAAPQAVGKVIARPVIGGLHRAYARTLELGRTFAAHASQESGIRPVTAREPVAERLVGSIRRELVDHVIVIGEDHLRALLTEFLDYYNTIGRTAPCRWSVRFRDRTVAAATSSPGLFDGLLHHVYARAA